MTLVHLGLSALGAMGHFMYAKFSPCPLWASLLSQAGCPPTLCLPLTPACLFSWGMAAHGFVCFPSTGEVIYNKTDGAGCQLYATCNQYCDVDRFQGACPSSPPPGPSTSASSPPPLPGCDNATPPRQVSLSSLSPPCDVVWIWVLKDNCVWIESWLVLSTTSTL